jgi:hypothetical protein
MANLPTRVLRLLVQRGHAMLNCELQDAFIGAKQPGAVHDALTSLKMARCIAWTDLGWLATDAGRQYVKLNRRLSFERRPA